MGSVFITGASRGIGKSIFEAFAKDVYTVYGTSTTSDGVAVIEKIINKYGCEGAGLKLNITQDDVDETIKNFLKGITPPSILVNNAGVTDDALLLRMKDFQWDRVIDTNLKGAFLVTKSLLRPMLKEKHGRIIFITSVVAELGNFGQGNYSASKAGIEGLSKSLAREVSSRDITVNCVAPGFIETEMTKVLPDDVKLRMAENIPMKKFGKSEDVANAVRFLASEKAGYITGTVLNVNGGMLMS